MPTQIICPSCQQYVNIDSDTGATIICPHCQAAIPPATLSSGSPPTHAFSEPPAAPAVPDESQRKGMAVASLVIGIIGCFTCPLVGVLGLILGIVALARANSQPRRYAGKGLAIGGICASAVGMVFSIVFMSLIISITLPSFARARELSKRTVCAANLKGIGMALQSYTGANGGELPPDLDTLVSDGYISPKSLHCPSADPGTISYEYDPEIVRSAGIDEPVIKESLENHRSKGQNILYGDGHVEFVPASRSRSP